MKFAKAGIVITIASLLSVIAGPVQADQYTHQIAVDQQRQRQLDQQIASIKAKIAADQDQETALTADIAQLNVKIAATEAQISAVQQQLAAINAQLSAAQAQLKATQAQLAADRAELATQKEHLAHALVVMYEAQQDSTALNNLLSSGDFNSFFTTVINDRRLSAAERDAVQQVVAQEATVQHDLDKVQQQVQAITETQHQRQGVLAALDANQATLDSERFSEQRAIAYLRADEARDSRLAAQWAAAYHALNGQIAYLNRKEQAAQAARRAGGGHGRFIWPDSGPITQGFGCTPFTFEAYDPSCPTLHFHNGIDIAGPCGNDILAADAGVVNEFWDPWGFGNYIVIVHGNGWATLYGHMSGFAVRSGATVRQGQLIGWEGTTGNSTGCHLHFGINHNGAWVNPLNYL